MEVLFSKTGSKGNASVISDGETLIQIDAGISPEKVNKKIGYALDSVSALLCTHVHQDHSKYLDKYLKLGIKVYACADVWLKFENTKSSRNAMIARSGTQFKVGTFIIKPFDVSHVNSDGTDCPNLGFLIYSTVTKEKMLWITDASYIESRFPAMDYICIECNYIDVDDYSGELPFVNKFVEQRRVKSHLSLDRCIEFLKQQDLSKVKWIRLLHLTESQGNIYNNIYNKMQEEFPGITFVI